MMISKVALPRRTVLRGIGAALALPLLDAMVPALSAASKTAANPVPRVGFIYLPNGQALENFIPTRAGTDFDFSPTLKPLETFRSQLVVVSGLSNLEAESRGLRLALIHVDAQRGLMVCVQGERKVLMFGLARRLTSSPPTNSGRTQHSGHWRYVASRISMLETATTATAARM